MVQHNQYIISIIINTSISVSISVSINVSIRVLSSVLAAVLAAVLSSMLVSVLSSMLASVLSSVLSSMLAAVLASVLASVLSSMLVSVLSSMLAPVLSSVLSSMLSSVFIFLYDGFPVPPRFGDGDEKELNELTDESLNSEVILNSTVHLKCPASANPPPQITWYKDGEEMHFDDYDDENGRIQIVDEGRLLIIRQSDVTDTATYTCIARNSVGEGEMTHKLNVQGERETHTQIHTCTHTQRKHTYITHTHKRHTHNTHTHNTHNTYIHTQTGTHTHTHTH